jgi:hypothetical protein
VTLAIRAEEPYVRDLDGALQFSRQLLHSAGRMLVFSMREGKQWQRRRKR